MPDTSGTETERFQIEDLFFSRTDDRGVILSANEVFCRVADMDWAELDGKPHKVIRHPKMPGAIFRLMWDTIKQGDPLGAYVVNQAKDGQHYWVFATVIITENGYMSVRLKPTSDVLPGIKALYAKMRACELDGDKDFAASTALFLDYLSAHGFVDYQAFMADAILSEISARNATIGRSLCSTLTVLSRIQGLVESVSRDTKEIEALFERTSQIPFNMGLQAVRMEGRDGPIGVISSNHQKMTKDLYANVMALRTAADLGTGPLQEAVFVAATSSLMDEVHADFLDGSGDDDTIILALRDQYQVRATEAVAQTCNRVQQLTDWCKDFKRMLTGLEMTRVMCKIEQARYAGDASALQKIAEELQHTEQNLSKVLTRLEKTVADIHQAAASLSSKTRRAA